MDHFLFDLDNGFGAISRKTGTFASLKTLLET
jgi:hypothetical protein